MRLSGKVAFVTGAGRGIGRGIATVYAGEGARVVVVDVDGDAAGRVAQELVEAGGNAVASTVDVTDGDACRAAIESTVQRFSRLDVLTHNVGIYPEARLDTMTEADWDRVHDVNLRSLFLVVRAALPHLRRSRGRITVTSSITGPRVGYPGLTHYAASKAGINGFVRSAAVELARDGITVNAVEPGTVLTEGLAAQLGDDDVARLERAIPLGRLASPRDIGTAHLFFASDDAGYITGQTLAVDGGQILPETPFALD